MIIGLGCACQEQSGTGIRGLGDCGDQPPASSVTYADWYNCWNAEQAHPTPPITNWIAFDGGGNPVSVTPATVSKPTVVVPYTAPLPTNIPVVSGPSTLPTDTYTSSTTDFKNIIVPPITTVPVVSTPANPVIGISPTIPVVSTGGEQTQPLGIPIGYWMAAGVGAGLGALVSKNTLTGVVIGGIAVPIALYAALAFGVSGL